MFQNAGNLDGLFFLEHFRSSELRNLFKIQKENFEKLRFVLFCTLIEHPKINFVEYFG